LTGLTETIVGWLFAISNALLLPVILTLLLLLCWSVFILGEFVGEAIRRRKRRWLVLVALNDWEQGEETRLDTFLSELEIRVMKKLESCHLVLRLGPIFGLVGTLIPLGPALQSLARGDMETLARNIHIAFATTVVGLVSAAIAFVVLTVRKRWYAQDLTHVEKVLKAVRVGESNEVIAS
jgi:biopolymer transport protein ExbB/TolQ